MLSKGLVVGREVHTAVEASFLTDGICSSYSAGQGALLESLGGRRVGTVVNGSFGVSCNRISEGELGANFFLGVSTRMAGDTGDK